MVYSHSLTLPWSISTEDQQRFRKVLGFVLALTIALGIAIPLLPTLKRSAEQAPELPPRVAKLIFEKRAEPKPPPKAVKKKPAPKPAEKVSEPVKKKPKQLTKTTQPKPVPKVDAVEQARKKASTAGLLALQDSLAELRDQSVDELKGSKRLANTGASARKTERALITSRVGKGSAGIDTSKLSRSAGSTQLASRTATEVKSGIATSPEPEKARSDRNASRSQEDIQMVFDRNKSAIFNIYNRALRRNPSLQGRLVVELSISPAGKVTDIKLVDSELNDTALEKKLLARIRMLNFGARAVDAVTVTFPIDFLPA